MSTLTPSGPYAAPLKVCPHCSTISQTDMQRCPSCNRSYRRRTRMLHALLWLIWLWIGFGVLAWLAVGLALR